VSELPKWSCAIGPNARLPEYAKLAEGLGYERVWVYDSPPLYHDQWMALARAADATDHIGLAAGVSVAFLRHPMVAASAIATLAELAPGRVIVAFGTGGSAARMLGRKPMPWVELEQYLVAVRGLLAGEVVHVDGRRVRMAHSPGFAPPRPIDVPLLVAPRGPKGFAVARRVADGVILNAPAPEAAGLEPCALLINGTVLEPGEDHTSSRVVEALGPIYATVLHTMFDMAPDVVASLPGGTAWMASVEEIAEEDRHWALHEGHLAAVTERDRPAVTDAGAAILQFGWAGERAAIRAKALDAAASGITELVYGPVGPNIGRELEAFAAALTD
jgi:5,10-methylenetetrahydromethanopterin reductase